jgi:tetratricopeptide (TPR) repeat protein
MDRYTRRELTPGEGRKLAQESLADPELFEELTASALATAAAASTRSDLHVHRSPRRTRFIAAAVAAAAGILMAFYLMRWKPNPPHEAAAIPQLRPALASLATPGQPILLASGLETAPNSSQIFRGVDPDSRTPRTAGSIVSITDGTAAIDLGSLDGLLKGTALEVYRGDKSVGRLEVATVFRERARTRILSGSNIRVSDQVRLPADIHLAALLEQMDASSGRGDSDGARRMGEKAVKWADSAGVSPARRVEVLEKLAALGYQAGSLQAAEKHYQMALNIQASFDAANTLAVLHMLRGDFEGAEALLRRVAAGSAKSDLAYIRSLNNLGVLAELQGQRRPAQAFYTDALQAAVDVPMPERQALETNLARIRGAR